MGWITATIATVVMGTTNRIKTATYAMTNYLADCFLGPLKA